MIKRLIDFIYGIEEQNKKITDKRTRIARMKWGKDNDSRNNLPKSNPD